MTSWNSPWNSPGQNPGVGSVCPSPGDLPNPGIKPRSPELQGDSLPAEPPGRPKNTGVGSLSLQIFLTQESNWGLLHCRQTHYQLSYPESKNTSAGCHAEFLSILLRECSPPALAGKVVGFFPSLKTIAPTWQAQAEGRAWKPPAEEDGVRTHACRAQWISSPAP